MEEKKGQVCCKLFNLLYLIVKACSFLFRNFNLSNRPLINHYSLNISYRPILLISLLVCRRAERNIINKKLTVKKSNTPTRTYNLTRDLKCVYPANVKEMGEKKKRKKENEEVEKKKSSVGSSS